MSSITSSGSTIPDANTQRWATSAPCNSRQRLERLNKLSGETGQGQFSKGLHCIGLWHSHPEPVPLTSQEDLELAADYANAARKQLSGIIFTIIGTAPFPSGPAIWVHNGASLHEVNPLKPTDPHFEQRHCVSDVYNTHGIPLLTSQNP